MSSPNIRRPLRPEEVPHLREMGAAFRALRKQAGVSVRALSEVAVITSRQVERIEQGTRRTCRSTLTRLVEAMLLAAPDLGERDVLVDRLCALAGPALAPESPYAAKSAERRRGKRERVQQRREMYAHLRD